MTESTRQREVMPDADTASITLGEANLVEPERGRFTEWLDRVIDDCKTLPEAITHPRSALETLRYAREGKWTTAKPGKGWLRAGATAWAYFAVGVGILLDTIKWSLGTFPRFVVSGASAVLIGTAVAHIPVVGAIVPNLVNITAW